LELRVNTPLFSVNAGLCLAPLYTACATTSPGTVDLDEAYRLALLDAAVIDADEVQELEPLAGEAARVVTWTAYPDSYVPGEDVTLGWGETWVTVDGAVRSYCVELPPETLSRDVQMLLGLPLSDRERSFVTLEVATADLFRPCADPSLDSPQCGLEFPEDVSEAYRSWFAGQTATAYQAPNGYPWTRLGYTYNWRPGANEVGVQEYVIRQGATARVVSVSDTPSYCRVEGI